MKQLSIILFLFILILVFSSCDTKTSSKDTLPEISKTDEIISKAIIAHGGDIYKTLDFNFTFRNRSYEVYRENGLFQYKRIFTDTLQNNIEDVLENNQFTRFMNGNEVVLTAKEQSRYSNSINSVIYFTLLPFPLDDEAVIKKHLGETTISGNNYDLVEVRFSEEGGGVDFEDVFLYWFNSETNKLDYLAYEFHVNNGGLRFREAFNSRTINGMLFQDYVNYKPADNTSTLYDLQQLFEDGKLIKLSEIVNTDIVFN